MGFTKLFTLDFYDNIKQSSSENYWNFYKLTPQKPIHPSYSLILNDSRKVSLVILLLTNYLAMFQSGFPYYEVIRIRMRISWLESFDISDIKIPPASHSLDNWLVQP